MVSYPHLQGGPLIGFTALFSLGVILGLFWVGFMEQTDLQDSRSAQRPPRLDRTNAAISALLGGLIGARLVFIALHLPYYREHPLEIIALWQGGLSAFGGVLGAILGVIVFTGKHVRQIWALLDDLALPSLIVTILTWIGCWLEGIAYGIQVPLDWVWLKNTDPFNGQSTRWPTQLVGALLALIAFLLLFRFGSDLRRGLAAGLTFTAVSLTLTLTGFFRADPSLLIFGHRLDLLGAALFTFIGLSLTIYHRLKPEKSRR